VGDLKREKAKADRITSAIANAGSLLKKIF